MDIKYIQGLKIGTVESVSPKEIKILLEINAPQATALNTGTPTPFPRINSYILIPNEVGAIVGMVCWVGIEHSPFPKRIGMKDFGLIDLPYPLRKMTIVPIGTLKSKYNEKTETTFFMERGVSIFPSVGDSVILPTENQLISIVEKIDEKAKVLIGVAPLAGNAKVYIDPDRLFGRHLAILGNTGSGKSCTVAGLIRWSLEKAQDDKSQQGTVNARFIILDPNGEYSEAFSDISKVRKFCVFLSDEEKKDTDWKSLKVPAWMWNSAEWINFAQAAPGAQRPMLLDALKDIKKGSVNEKPIISRLKRFLNGHLIDLKKWLSTPPSNMQWSDRQNCGRKLINLEEDINNIYLKEDDLQEFKKVLSELSTLANKIWNSRNYSSNNTNGFNEFSETDLTNIIQKINSIIEILPKQESSDLSTITADTPLRFDVINLPEYLENLASGEGQNIAQFVSMLTLRIKLMLSDVRLNSIITPEEEITLSNWLDEYIGNNNAENGNVALIDLSLVPADVIHLVVAVMTRLIFEALQRYRKIEGKELPTVLVLEEAHNFVRKKGEEYEDNVSKICCEIFEKISREGRKFGLGLVLSSQRPSEVSPTVLAQCNTFILHRIVNDRDQQLVSKLVPDTAGSLIGELPTLPTRQAIVVGWATPIPIIVEINELTEKQRPHSADPFFWDVWTGIKSRPIDWEKISNEWQERK